MKETWFQSLSGLTLGLNIIRVARAATEKDEFQSLSGLTLGLNEVKKTMQGIRLRFNPFQG